MRTLTILALAILATATLAAAQPLGDTLVVGDTWREIQSYGAPGPTAAIDQAGDIFFVWHDSDDPYSERYIMMNAVDPNGQLFFPGGSPLTYENSGWPVCDLYQQSYLAVSMNGTVYGEWAYYGAAIWQDFDPGIFSVLQPIHWVPWSIFWWSPPDTVYYPRIRIDGDNRFHFLVSTLSPSAGDAVALKHISAQYDSTIDLLYFDSSWTFVDSLISPTYELAASPVSDRLAFGWTTPHDDHWNYQPSYWDNDLMLLIDDDGQDLHFEDAFNLTSFIDPDPSWLPDTTTANMDTFRVHDFSIMLDDNDYCHVVFTTRAYFEIQGTSYWHASIIWHWSEQFPDPYQIKVIHNAFDDWWWNYTDCGAWNVKAQKPTLVQDPETGYLYCVYQVYDCDTTHLSAFMGQTGWGMPSGEVYASVSTDGGLNWSVGTNITQTITQQNAPSGQCWSEVCPYPAGVTDGYLHIQYVLDKDAGNCLQTEGNATLNPVIYQKVPVDSIPTTPLVPQNIFLHVFPVGVEPTVSLNMPSSIRFHPCHPNPFNFTTVLTFDLPLAGWVKLEVFDIKGRSVGIQNLESLQAGSHRIPFDGSDLPSGIYLARLMAGDFQQTQKLVLLK